MSSINPVNPGAGDLLRTFLGNGSSPVSQLLSSTAAQSALEAASPGDLVQLSAQAVQSLQAAGLFGASGDGGEQSATTDFGSIALQALDGDSASGSTSTTAPTTTSGASFAQQEAAVLFAGSLGTEAANSTLSLVG